MAKIQSWESVKCTLHSYHLYLSNGAYQEKAFPVFDQINIADLNYEGGNSNSALLLADSYSGFQANLNM